MLKKILLLLLFPSFLFSIDSYFSIYDGQIIKNDFSGLGKSIIKSGTWKLRDGGTYIPSVSGAILKVKASGVTIDLENYAIDCKNSVDSLTIAVEVGFSPAELKANPKLKQISNITIKNGDFINFDIGFIVHSGVRNLKIENCDLNGVFNGYIFLGEKDNEIMNVSVLNSNITGHSKHSKEKMILLKNKIEGKFSIDGNDYGNDLFSSLLPDVDEIKPYDLFNYFGFFAKHVQNFNLKNIGIQNIGLYSSSDELIDSTLTTQSIGMLFKKSFGISISSSYVCRSVSELKSVGIRFDESNHIDLNNIKTFQNKSFGCAIGLEVIGSRFADVGYSLIHMNSVSSYENHVLDNNVDEVSRLLGQLLMSKKAVGMSVIGPSSVKAENISCSCSFGSNKVYGFYADKLINSAFKNCSFHGNESLSSYDSIDSLSIGFYAKNSSCLEIKDCDFSNNIGNNSGIGMNFAFGTNLTIRDSKFSGNIGKKDNSEQLNLISNDKREIESDYAPTGKQFLSGGYGFYGNDSSRLAFLSCNSSNNSGYRAFGYRFDACSISTMHDSVAIYQQANGDFLASEIKELDYKEIDAFLSTIEKIRKMWLKKYTEVLPWESIIIKSFVSIFQKISPYRLWGVAYGVHLHNCNQFLIKDNQFSGQVSNKDNAAGCVVSGNSRDFYMEGNEFSYNYGWNNSFTENISDEKAYEFRYDFSAIKSFIKLFDGKITQAKNKHDIGFYYNDDKLYLNGKVELDDSGEDIAITVDRTSRKYVSIVAPISAGLIISDFCSGGILMQNKFSSNKGNSGYCAGLLFNNVDSVLVQNNLFENNSSNIYGHCYGLIDTDLYCENNYIQNRLSFNFVDGFYNSHSLIVADNRKDLSNVYPKSELNTNNGARNQSEFNNIEVIVPVSIKSDKKEIYSWKEK